MNDAHLTPEQVHEIVQELREADYQRAGSDFFAERVNRLNNAGWVLGIVAYRQAVNTGRRGYKLKRPRYEWRNIAHWYNNDLGIKVWYWNNFGYSKYQAELFAKDNPPPAGTFTLYTK